MESNLNLELDNDDLTFNSGVRFMKIYLVKTAIGFNFFSIL